MAVFNKTLLQSYILRLTVTVTSQSIENNTSTLSWVLQIIRGTGSGRYRLDDDNDWTVTINGTKSSGAIPYDFRPLTQGQALTVASGSRVVGHNADGSKNNMPVAATFNDKDSGGILDGSLTGSMTLTRIPRGGKIRVAGVWNPRLRKIKVAGSWATMTRRVKVGGAWLPIK